MLDEFAKPAFRLVLVVYALAISVTVACVAGLLSWMGGTNAANSALVGLGAFGATLTVILAVAQFLAKK